MSEFASGVTVITALADGEPVGFACQSFASLSLEPPLILFCARQEGRAWARIRQAETFCVNVLAEDQGDLCMRFGSPTGKRFEELSWERSAWQTPSLPEVLARVHCTLETVHSNGDHDIAIGRVHGLEVTDKSPAPLLFHRGQFGLSQARTPDIDELWGWGDGWG